MQLDVIVELLRDTRREIECGYVGRGVRRDLNASLDFADLVRVLRDRSAVVGAETRAQAVQLATKGVENASALLHPSGPFLRRSPAAEEPLERDLRVELHRQRAGARRRFVVGRWQLDPGD